MSERSQRETLSVRISHSLRRRLEAIRLRASTTSGRAVSMSDVANGLLESVRGHGVEVADLLAEPTRALLDMRRKREAGLPLTPAEWTVLAHFVRQGMESTRDNLGRPSTASVVAVLGAFLSVYGLRKRASAWDAYYLASLPSECRPVSPDREDASADMSARVRQTVAETQRRLTLGSSEALWPVRAGRNLHLLLEEDEFAGGEVLNDALAPYWSVLWSMAARGHYALTDRPVRAKTGAALTLDTSPMASVADGRLRLWLTHGEELGVVVTFPGDVCVIYPVQRYPEIREFRMMVAALGTTAREWNGGHFRGYIVDAKDGVCFRARKDGITIGCRLADWERLRMLCEEAWGTSETQRTWERLTIEYGEL